MRVICIDDSPCPLTGSSKLTEGQEYNVSEIMASNGYGFSCKGIHPFKSVKNGIPVNIVAAKKERFLPLSEIDERGLAHAEPIESTFILKEV